MAAALEGVSGQQHAPAALYPRERPGTHSNVPSKWVNKLYRMCLENTELLFANQQNRLRTSLMKMTYLYTQTCSELYILDGWIGDIVVNKSTGTARKGGFFILKWGIHKLVKHPESSVSKLRLVKVWNILT